MTVPSEQKALFLESKLGEFVVRTTETPKPGPEDVLVKIEAAALNPLDWMIQATGFFVDKYPAILGGDGAGTVVEIGSSVVSLSVGDRVVAQAQFSPVEQAVHGTFLQYFVVPAKLVAKIPPTISFEDAACLPSGVATAAFPLYNQAKDASSVRLTAPWSEGGRNKYAQKPILVLAGASSMGQFVIQFARLSGFSPIVVTASLHNAEFLKSLGATHVLDRKLPAETLKAEATKIAGGLFGVVYDAISSPDTLPVGFALTAPQGDFVIVHSADELEAEGKKIGKRVHMTHGIISLPVNEEVSATLLASLYALVEAGDIKPNRTEVLPGGLNGIVGGLERLKNNQVSGVKLVVRPHDTN